MGIFEAIRSAISGSNVTQTLPDDSVLIDVRSPGEFSQGHIEGSTNCPVGDLAARIAAICPDKSANIIVFCASGMRSSTARNVLINMGYSSVFNGGGVGGLARHLNKRLV